MSDTIMIKSGALGDREAMPKLNEAELGYRTDTEELYIGGGEGNKRLCGVGDVADINAKIDVMEGDIENIIARLEALEAPSE